jgi:hypothetical protein
VGHRVGLDAVGNRKKSLPCRESNPGRPARRVVTMLPELSRIPDDVTMELIIIYLRTCAQSNYRIVYSNATYDMNGCPPSVFI